jgi:hypothetical protein
MDIESIAKRVAAFSKDEMVDKADGFWSECFKELELLKGNMENPWDDVDYDKCTKLCQDLIVDFKYMKNLRKDIEKMK